MLKLELTIDEGQQILNVLVKEPYKEVYELIMKIQEQAREQLSEKVKNVE